MKKLLGILTITALTVSSLSASTFVDYKTLTKKLKSDYKKEGKFASEKIVKQALELDNWIVVDVRKKTEWSQGHIQGSHYVGRESMEKEVAKVALDKEGNFTKNKVIVVCNSASRASVEAETFKKMGFKDVRIYGIFDWIDNCNPIVTGYSKKKNKLGRSVAFGDFKSSHCFTK